MEVPALQERPELMPHLSLLWRCFWQASKARLTGGLGGVGGIPLTEVEALARLWRITDWDAQLEFVDMIDAMDHEYLLYHHEQDEAKKPKKPVSEVSH